jgi:threonine dehydrogenase-like Zn-dependent dehydrogenase
MVEKAGSRVDPSWVGKSVFAFHPHASHIISSTDQLVELPESVDPLAAVFLANTETAVNLLLDGNPRLGERVVILGQGIVGLLVTAILSRFPLAGIYVLDHMARRRACAAEIGAAMACDPGNEADFAALKKRLNPRAGPHGADLVYELTGMPEAMNMAIGLCGYAGRIVTGSWYGTRTANLELGGNFHRNRISITSSQVSTIAPGLTGRWNKLRRFATAWKMISAIRPETLVTHRIPLAEAGGAYRLLHETPEQALQVVLTYEE